MSDPPSARWPTMPDPLTLFDLDEIPVVVQPPPTGSIDASFRAFHHANPWVYVALVALARDMHGRGCQRIGIKMLYEVLRWQYLRATTDPTSDFHLNNNYTARFARLIMDNEADLAGVFETRMLRSA